MKLNLITMAAWVACLVWFGLHWRTIAWTDTRVAGAAIAGIAVVFLFVARIQLGGSFSVSAKARKLVTTGLYAKLRNPIYVFAGMFILGLALLTASWKFALILLAVVPLQIYRARKEEQVLTAAFGDEYLRYKAGTWF